MLCGEGDISVCVLVQLIYAVVSHYLCHVRGTFQVIYPQLKR